MSTLHKVKAYFGMAPLDDYEDEYYEDEDRPARGYSRRPREDRFEEADYPERPGRRYDRDRDYGGRDYDRDYGKRDYDERDYDEPYRGGYREDDRFEPRPRPREFTPPSRPERAARLHPRCAGDGSAADGRVVRREQPVVEDHHAAPEGLQRGPHHR